ncbi:hypothetical protein [Ruegeria arenilitoris]|uniref:hypothetical protein n=1 Tax=Ruegeria arenilitoris TaxID=1173585 RepID=UPI001480F8FA|nr:hypothetical protein [Ruegeria arenilitoris]
MTDEIDRKAALSLLDPAVRHYARKSPRVGAPRNPSLVRGPCLIWQGGIRGGSASRPAMMYMGRSTSAARVSYYLSKDRGFPIFAERDVLIRHICGNGLCVNPDHLIPGTKDENERDKRMHGVADLYERLPPDPETTRIFREYVATEFGVDVPDP